MTILREILIYANVPYKKFRWISYVSLAQIGFITLNFMFLPNESALEMRKNLIKKDENGKKIVNELIDSETEQNHETTTNVNNQKSLINRIIDLDYRNIFSIETTINNIKENPYLAGASIIGSSFILTSMYYYAKRSIHTITLLPNERVRFELFSPFALRNPPTLEVPLRHVSCKTERKSKNNYSILKIKGYTGYHLVHKTDGHFLEPKLYDKYLGYERVWSK